MIPGCQKPGCRGDAAIVERTTDALLCAKCAAKHVAELPLAIVAGSFKPLIRPLLDLAVVLRDGEPPGKGLIIIPESAKDRHGRPIGAYECATGVILALGPGYQQRKGMGGLTGPYTRERKPLYSRVGARIVWRAKHEKAFNEWRGLWLVHDLEILSEIEPEEAVSAA